MSIWKPDSSLRLLSRILVPWLYLLQLAGPGIPALPAQEEVLPPAGEAARSPSSAQRLEWAVENNDAALTARILRNEPELLQGPLPSGASPLGIAVEASSWETMDLLLDRGAALQGRDRKGNQALLSAYLGNQRALVRKLLDRGADLQSQDGFGNTALHLLGQFTTTLWSQVLSEGFDLEARNYLGQTPFMRAVWEGNLTVADLLVQEGALTREADYLGRTAWDYARRMGDEALQLYLDTLP